MENLHAGHRKRMRQSFLNGGGRSLQDHNILEMLLFYVIPRRDTNEMAHIILNKAGSLTVLFTASVDDLVSKYGLTERVAEYIFNVGRLSTSVPRQSHAKRNLNDKIDVIKQLAREYKTVKKPCLQAVLLNVHGACITKIELKIGFGKIDRESLEALLATAQRYDSSEVILAHCVPKDSEWEIKSFATAENILRSAGLTVAECVYVCNGKYKLTKRHDDGINL